MKTANYIKFVTTDKPSNSKSFKTPDGDLVILDFDTNNKVYSIEVLLISENNKETLKNIECENL